MCECACACACLWTQCMYAHTCMLLLLLVLHGWTVCEHACLYACLVAYQFVCNLNVRVWFILDLHVRAQVRATRLVLMLLLLQMCLNKRYTALRSANVEQHMFVTGKHNSALPRKLNKQHCSANMTSSCFASWRQESSGIARNDCKRALESLYTHVCTLTYDDPLASKLMKPSGPGGLSACQWTCWWACGQLP